MGLFKPDLYRSFVVGFAVGAVIVLSTMGSDIFGGVVNGVAPPAEARATN